MRLFAAVPIPEPVKDSFLDLQHGVRGARWRQRENVHITLCFFGEVDAAQADELMAGLGDIHAPTLILQPARGGVFGQRKPRTLWAGLEPNPELDKLAGACIRVAREVGLAAPGKRYVPHITLAYCRGTRDVDAAQFLQRMSGWAVPPFPVDHFNLYRSELGRHPARHTVEAQYPLA